MSATIDTPKAFHLLRMSRKKLSKQQYKTLCGQINAGDINGAMRGLEKLLKRQINEKNEGATHGKTVHHSKAQ